VGGGREALSQTVGAMWSQRESCGGEEEGRRMLKVERAAGGKRMSRSCVRATPSIRRGAKMVWNTREVKLEQVHRSKFSLFLHNNVKSYFLLIWQQ
jgi:hypothetical protein